MNKFCIIFLSLIIISVTALGFSGVWDENAQNGGGRYEASLSQADERYLRRIYIEYALSLKSQGAYGRNAERRFA